MRILVVEDEHKIANSLKKGLEQESFAVDLTLGVNLGGGNLKKACRRKVSLPRPPRY